MTYPVTLSPAAARQLRKFDPHTRRRIQAALDLLADHPRPPAAKQSVGGAGEWRVRTGDDRIVYEINHDVLMVLVLTMGHRRDVYRKLWRGWPWGLTAVYAWPPPLGGSVRK